MRHSIQAARNKWILLTWSQTTTIILSTVQLSLLTLLVGTDNVELSCQAELGGLTSKWRLNGKSLYQKLLILVQTGQSYIKMWQGSSFWCMACVQCIHTVAHYCFHTHGVDVCRCAYLVGNVQEYVTVCLELVGKCILLCSNCLYFIKHDIIFVLKFVIGIFALHVCIIVFMFTSKVSFCNVLLFTVSVHSLMLNVMCVIYAPYLSSFCEI